MAFKNARGSPLVTATMRDSIASRRLVENWRLAWRGVGCCVGVGVGVGCMVLCVGVGVVLVWYGLCQSGGEVVSDRGASP